METPMTWRTSLSDVAPNDIRVRGYPIDELMTEADFSAAFFTLLRGEVPDADEAALFSAVLTASLDHGLTPPSTQATRLVTSGGASLPAATAAGLTAIGEHHGGAMLECQRLLESILADGDTTGDVEARAATAVDEYLDVGDPVPGFGHRYHDPDPRAVALEEMLAERGDGPHLTALKAVRRALHERVGSNVHPNVDGAIAAVLGELGIDPAVSQAVFVVGRAAGLTAHSHEERTREDPMRNVGPEPNEITYDGPDPRSLFAGEDP
ncbi:MAG: citryl-CoA lyase [Halanaeroarchaeum sp.]